MILLRYLIRFLLACNLFYKPVDVEMDVLFHQVLQLVVLRIALLVWLSISLWLSWSIFLYLLRSDNISVIHFFLLVGMSLWCWNKDLDRKLTLMCENNYYCCLSARQNIFQPLFFQILLIVLNALLFVMSLYDVIFSRRDGGDPTKVNIPVEPRTYGNPGFRERGAGINSKIANLN